MAGYIGSKAAVVTPGAERIKTYAITSTTTVLTGLVYSPGFVHVFHNGVRLTNTTDYTATDGSTITLLTAAQNGDEVVVVSYATFQIADTVSASAGGTFQNAVSFSAGSASIPGISVTGDTNTGLFSPAADTVAVATGGAERLRVDSSGNVGVGTASPGAILELNAGTNSDIRVNTSASGYLQLGQFSNGAFIATSSTDATAGILRLGTGGSEKMRISVAGNVGIGAAGPSAKLDILGDTSNQLRLRTASTEHYAIGRNASTGFLDFAGSQSGYIGYTFGGADGERMRIDSSGRVTMPSQTSFFARPPANYAINSDTTVGGTWSVVRNNGNNFNASGGIFTAPVAGVYSFVWSVFITDDAPRRDSYLLVNDTQIARTEITGYPTATSNISSLVAANLYLSANDAVKFGAHSASGSIYTAQSPWSYACGHLLG